MARTGRLPPLNFPATPDSHSGVVGLLPVPVRLQNDDRYDGRGVTIAFVDIGFYPHPDLVEPLRRIAGTVDLTGRKAETDCAFDSRDPTSWHGMMCSVVGAGNGWLSQGYYRGLAPAADVVLVRVGRSGRVREPDIYRGLAWILGHHREYGIRIVSLSVGGDRPSPSAESLVDRLVAQLTDAGLLVVCAGGNRPVPRLVPPASAPQGLTVGGLNDHNSPQRSQWQMYPCSYGPTVDGVAKPEVIAPAIWVPSPFLPGSDMYKEAEALGAVVGAADGELRERLQAVLPVMHLDPLILSRSAERIRAALRTRQNSLKWAHPYYQYVDGTSVAAPVVAALAAQLLQANPALAPADLKRLICETAHPLPGVLAAQQGAGVIQPAAAVRQTVNDLTRPVLH